jgi:hypothetical protein
MPEDSRLLCLACSDRPADRLHRDDKAIEHPDEPEEAKGTAARG